MSFHSDFTSELAIAVMTAAADLLEELEAARLHRLALRNLGTSLLRLQRQLRRMMCILPCRFTSFL